MVSPLTFDASASSFFGSTGWLSSVLTASVEGRGCGDGRAGGLLWSVSVAGQQLTGFDCLLRLVHPVPAYHKHPILGPEHIEPLGKHSRAVRWAEIMLAMFSGDGSCTALSPEFLIMTGLLASSRQACQARHVQCARRAQQDMLAHHRHRQELHAPTCRSRSSRWHGLAARW